MTTQRAVRHVRPTIIRALSGRGLEYTRNRSFRPLRGDILILLPEKGGLWMLDSDVVLDGGIVGRTREFLVVRLDMSGETIRAIVSAYDQKDAKMILEKHLFKKFGPEFLIEHTPTRYDIKPIDNPGDRMNVRYIL
jgi:hypothetical protein